MKRVIAKRGSHSHVERSIWHMHTPTQLELEEESVLNFKLQHWLGLLKQWKLWKRNCDGIDTSSPAGCAE